MRFVPKLVDITRRNLRVARRDGIKAALARLAEGKEIRVSTTELKYQFLEQVVRKLDGWLLDAACIRTLDLLEFQEDLGLPGPLLEIGVYGGKYFSVLLRSAQVTGAKVVGVDTFQFKPLDEVKAALEAQTRRCRTPPTFIARPSSECDAQFLLQQLGAPPRFVSVDGSHERNDVFWDMRLTEAILANEGLVAVDDFLNPMTLGVNEALHLFFAQPRNLAPVAYVANKLFLSRPAWAKRYRDHLEAVVTADTVEPGSAQFRENAKKWRGMVEIPLWGTHLLCIP
jgi:hypothetical protein